MSEHSKYVDFENRLQKVYKRLHKIASKKGVSCYRIYDLDLPDFPFMIDLYGDKLYVAEYQRNHQLDEQSHAEWIDKSKEIIAKIIGIPLKSIFFKKRKSIKERNDQYVKSEESEVVEYVVEEGNLKFYLNLTTYLDTGLFLDHRPTRAIVKELAAGKKVLNLFAYTGSFSVFAAAGGATEVTTIDLSNTYIQWAKRNMATNGFTNVEKYIYHQEDVLQFLKFLPFEYYDIIILDPPTFSNSKRMEDVLDTQRDHASMINQCLDLLTKNGQLFFSTNYTKFKLNVEEIKTHAIKDITARTTDFDFERKLDRKCYLIEKGN
ncbi:MAG: class I SAM-dependent methyltransferase [Saprospiraceae bacterium]|nr:class I SAM-dependent methyltransferase [Saprospiraceae bacterium]